MITSDSTSKIKADDLPPLPQYPMCLFGVSYLDYNPEDEDEKTLDVSLNTPDARGRMFVPSDKLWYEMCFGDTGIYQLKRSYFIELKLKNIPPEFMLRVLSQRRITFLGEYLKRKSRNYLFFIAEYMREVAIDNKIILNDLGLVKSRKR